MTKTELALDYYSRGFNCSQSVLGAFTHDLEARTNLFRAAGALGGGVRSGEVCGAVSGACLVIGMKYGQLNDHDPDSKNLCYSKTDEFIDRFRLSHPELTCRANLGLDVRTQKELILERGLHQLICKNLVASAAAILEELGY